MTEVFNRAFEETVGLEGGFVDDKDDPGGRTKYGISQRSYPNIDIANLTLERAKAIYWEDFWTRLKCDEMTHAAVAGEIFDTAVNMGIYQAIIIAQRACNLFGSRLHEDGGMGPNTLAAINRWSAKDAEALFKALNGEQYAVYKAIIENRETSRKYARGWMKRIQDFREV